MINTAEITTTQTLTHAQYPAYKDSGVNWLGEIPAHWKVRRIKTVIISESNGVWGDDPKTPAAIYCIRVADFDRFNLAVRTNKLTLRDISKKDFESRRLQKGDLLIEKSGGGEKQLVGQVVIFLHEFDAVCSNFVARIRLNSEIESRFMNYVFCSLYANSINYKHIKQTTGIQNLDSQSYFNELFVLPPLSEQTRIAEFLNRKTAQIDQAIAQKERLIELLNERRQAMIQKAITRGLNPNVPMKDSGIDWIGEIPAHWEVKRAKYLFEEVVVNTKTGKEELLSLRMNIGLVPHNDVSDIEITDTNLIGYKIVEVGQMVMNRMRASIGLFGIANQHGLVSPDYAVYEVSNDVCPSYYLTLFKTSIMGTVFRLNSKGLGTGSSGFMRIYSENFGNIKIQVPPKEEQQAISDYIEFVTSQVENGISYMETAIQKLQELKSTLINSAVTGKIKV